MTQRLLYLLSAMFLLLICGAVTAPADDGVPTTRRSKEGDIASMETYYAKLYSGPLAMKSRLPKLVALLSLAKIDCGPTSSALIEAAGNRDPIVSYLAWQILSARQASLNPAYREYWVQRGIELAAGGEMPGSTIVPMLDAAVSIPHVKVKKLTDKLFDLVLRRYSPSKPNDVPVLKSAGALLAAWNDPALLQRVMNAVGDNSNGPTAEYLLVTLPGAPAKLPDATDQRRGALQRLVKSAATVGPATRPFTVLGKEVPAPARITDPEDPRWRKELELGKLSISSFDLAWVIDSTGSMAETNQAVAAQTARVMRFISLFSDQSRVGAVYFRHEIDPKLQLKCCVEAVPPAYQTKVLPLNKEAGVTAKLMATESIGKRERKMHNTHPGSAVNGGLLTALIKMDWSKEPDAQRVIILIGDSPLTDDTEAPTVELAKDAVKKGFQIHAITTTVNAANSWHPVIVAAGGVHWGYRPPEHPGGHKTGDIETINDYAAVAKVLIRNCVSPQYRDRIDPLIAALEPFIEQAEATGR
ncbi:hypothetical protein BH10PLA1_BH10PLA1_08210 [soil metagenome]